MGTIDYVSPEQIRGEQLDGKADQYGLACLLFECLTGTVPYRRRSDVAAIFAHLEDAVPIASEREAGLPVAVDAVLARGMAKQPEQRYRELRRARRRHPRCARPGRRRVRVAPPRARARRRRAARRGRDRDHGARARRRRSGAARVHGIADARRHAHEQGHRARGRRRPSRPARGDLRRGLDGRLPRRQPVALRAVGRQAGEDHLERRAARCRRARRQGVRGRGRPLPVGHRLALRRGDRRARGRDRPARVRDGLRAKGSSGRPGARSSSA